MSQLHTGSFCPEHQHTIERVCILIHVNPLYSCWSSEAEGRWSATGAVKMEQNFSPTSASFHLCPKLMCTPTTSSQPATHTSAPAQVVCKHICTHSYTSESVTLHMPALGNPHPLTHMITTHNRPWGDHLSWGRIYSRSPCATGSDLRHSSGNLCPSSCGLIRLCRPWRQRRPGNYEGIQSITHLQATFQSVSVCMHM